MKKILYLGCSPQKSVLAFTYSAVSARWGTYSCRSFVKKHARKKFNRNVQAEELALLYTRLRLAGCVSNEYRVEEVEYTDCVSIC